MNDNQRDENLKALAAGAVEHVAETFAQLAALAAGVPGFVLERFGELAKRAAEVEKETLEAKALGMSLAEYRIRKEYPDLLLPHEQGPGDGRN